MRHYINKISWPALVLMLGSLLLSITFAELIMRWHMFGKDAWSYSQMYSLRHIGESELLQPSPFQDILWELKPGVSSVYKLKPFNTNSHGQRDKEYSLVKPDGVFRVAVIGDSFTMGEGVAAEDTYQALLEERFNAESNGQTYEFIDFGVSGYSLPQYIATIKHKAVRFQPDLIFIGFCAANDSKLPNMEAFNHPFIPKAAGNGFFNVYFFEHIGNIYKTIYHYLRNRKPGYNADEQYVNSQFLKLAELTTQHKIPVVLAYIDNKAPSADYSMVRTAAERVGFTFIDATSGFSSKINPEHIIYRTDSHPNGVANHIIADNLYHELIKKQIIKLN